MYKDAILKEKWTILGFCGMILAFTLFIPTRFVTEQTDTYLGGGPNGLFFSQCYQHAVDIYGIEFPSGRAYAFGWHLNNETFICSGIVN